MNQLFLKQNTKHGLEKQKGSIIVACALHKKINRYEHSEVAITMSRFQLLAEYFGNH